MNSYLKRTKIKPNVDFPNDKQIPIMLAYSNRSFGNFKVRLIRFIPTIYSRLDFKRMSNMLLCSSTCYLFLVDFNDGMRADVCSLFWIKAAAKVHLETKGNQNRRENGIITRVTLKIKDHKFHQSTKASLHSKTLYNYATIM